MIVFNKETREFGFIQNIKQKAQNASKIIKTPFTSNMMNKNTRINMGNTKLDARLGLNQSGQFGKSGATFNNRLGITGKTTSKLTSGNIADRFNWNRGGSSRALGGQTKLTAGSKVKIGLTGLAAGAVTGKVAGSIAQSKAHDQALKAGLVPGSAAYNKFIKQKTQGAKTLGKIVGGAAGLAGARFLGKNTFKLQ